MSVSISSSVGASPATNRPKDVFKIQLLLNKVRLKWTLPPIAMDGDIGPETKGAILDFQKRFFGWTNPDGRVDAGGTSLKNMNALVDEPATKTNLLAPVQHYRKGIWQVDVGVDGEIIVQPGDWLSKYSAAIYGDFYTVWPFMRLGSDGLLYNIQNINLIHAGERIYDLNTFLKFFNDNKIEPPKAPSRKTLTKADEKKITEDVISKDFNLRGERAKALTDALDIVSKVDAAASVAEVAGLIAEGTVIAGAATALAFVTIFTDLMGNVIGFLNALETGERLAGMRAIAYTTVAWAFDDAIPQFSAKFRRNMQSGLSGPAEIQRCQKAWEDAAKSTVIQMEAGSLGRYGKARSLNSQKVLIQAGKNRIKQLENGNKRAISLSLMKALEPKLQGAVLTVWKAGYDYAYNE